MHKNIFQDMVKTKNENRKTDLSKNNKIKEDISPVFIKKTNQNIKIKKVTETSLPLKNKEENFSEYNYTIEDFNKDKINKNKNNIGIWFFVFLSLFFLFFTLSSYLTKASIVINPKVIDLNLSDSFKANKDLDILNENLAFQLMIIEDSISKEIISSGEVDAQEKAVGRVVIYNAFSNTPQSLSAETRLENPDKKIFKIKEKVLIPGMSEDGIPGSIEVDIIANEAGESYNIPPTDFELIGFKGTSKYKKIYARSLGATTGGFKGKKSVIDEELRNNTEKEIKLELESLLLKKALEQIPPGYVLFKNASLFKFYPELKTYEGDSKKAFLEVNGKLSAFLFEEKNLTKNILKTKLPKESTDDVYILNLRDLNFSLENQNTNLEQLAEITFKLTGNSFVVSLIDDKELLNKLLGQPKKNFNNILFKYDNIKDADLVIKPFWQNKIPEDKNKVKIEVNYP